MPTVTVNFKGMLQDSQDVGSDDDHMVSRVFFSVTADGQTVDNLHSDVKQTVGSDYATEPLEVTRPAYDGPMNWTEFRQCVESYYRQALRRFVRYSAGTVIRMRDNRVELPQSCSFEAAGTGGAGW